MGKFDISMAWFFSDLKSKVLQAANQLEDDEPEDASATLIEVIEEIHSMEFQRVSTRLTLRQVRENLRLTLKEAAERSGIAESTLREWEKDSREAESGGIQRLLQLYHISVDHIYVGRGC